MVAHAIVDTDILVDILRVHPPAVKWWNSEPQAPAVCGFSAYELYEGCRNRRNVLQVTELLQPLQMLWPSPSACSEGLAMFPARLLRMRLGVMDSLIAACARESDVPLYTFNTKHFRAVDGLVMEQPYTR